MSGGFSTISGKKTDKSRRTCSAVAVSVGVGSVVKGIGMVSREEGKKAREAFGAISVPLHRNNFACTGIGFIPVEMSPVPLYAIFFHWNGNRSSGKNSVPL